MQIIIAIVAFVAFFAIYDTFFAKTNFGKITALKSSIASKEKKIGEFVSHEANLVVQGINNLRAHAAKVAELNHPVAPAEAFNAIATHLDNAVKVAS